MCVVTLSCSAFFGSSRNDGVQIRCHDVIYRVMEDIREVLSDNLPTAMEVNILGRAKVQEVRVYTRCAPAAYCSAY